MTTISYRLTCDACNKREFNEGHDNECDMLLDARKDGWRRRNVSNGSQWDYCPRCNRTIGKLIEQETAKMTGIVNPANSL